MSKALTCWEDLLTRVKSMDLISPGKVVMAYDPVNLVAQMKAVPPPMIGVVYEGMRASQEGGSARQGLATNAVFGVYLGVNSPLATAVNTKPEALMTMEAVRQKILGQISPSGHKWAFLVENFVDQEKSLAIWVQRWETVIVNSPSC